MVEANEPANPTRTSTRINLWSSLDALVSYQRVIFTNKTCTVRLLETLRAAFARFPCAEVSLHCKDNATSARIIHVRNVESSCAGRRELGDDPSRCCRESGGGQ